MSNNRDRDRDSGALPPNPAGSPAGEPSPELSPDEDDNLGPFRLPQWYRRGVIYAIVMVLVAMLGLWAFDQLRSLLILLFVSLFLSVAIEPAVNWLAGKGVRRGLGTGLVFLILFVAVVGFSVEMGAVVVTQVESIVKNFPQLLDDSLRWVNQTFHTKISTDWISDKVKNNSWSLSSYAGSVAGSAVGISVSVIGALFQGFTVCLFTFYMSAEGPRMRRAVCSLLPPKRQREVLRAWNIAVDKTGGYLYSRLLLAIISTIFHYAAMRVIGIPQPLALAIWVGLVSQFIPTIGTYLAGALPVLVGLANDPIKAFWMLAFIIVYQQVENYLFAPKITARTVEVHPAVAFGSVMAGAALLGGVGAIIAIPASASIQAFISTYLKRYDVEDHAALEDRARGRRRRRIRNDEENSPQ